MNFTQNIPKGAYFVRLTEQEKALFPNPELTYYEQYLDGAYVGLFRLIPGQEPQPVPPSELNLKDSRELEQEITNTVNAIVTPKGIVLPSEFQYPVKLPNLAPHSWGYMRVEKSLISFYAALPSGEVIGYPLGESEKQHYYDKFIEESVTTREERDRVVKVSAILTTWNSGGDENIHPFSALPAHTQFRLLRYPDGPVYESREDGTSFRLGHPTEVIIVTPIAICVILDQSPPKEENPLSDLVETPQTLREPLPFLILLEHMESKRHIAIIGTQNTDERITTLVNRSFGPEWMLYKWDQITDHSFNILKEVGWTPYLLGNPYVLLT